MNWIDFVLPSGALLPCAWLEINCGPDAASPAWAVPDIAVVSIAQIKKTNVRMVFLWSEISKLKSLFFLADSSIGKHYLR